MGTSGTEPLGSFSAAVEACKSRSQVERAFRAIKTARLTVRPVDAVHAGRVRAHGFPCMLARHVERHLRRRLAPLLSGDDDREAARARRTSPRRKAGVSGRAGNKAAAKITPDGFPVHSLNTLLADLATLALNDVTAPGRPEQPFTPAAAPAPLQAEAFRRLGTGPTEAIPVT